MRDYMYRFFLIWYGCGVILVGFDILPPWLEWANVLFLVLAGTMGGIYFINRYGNKNGWFLISTIFILSILAEYLGATYGWIFGSYDYTDEFGFKLFHVPITIGFAWMMVMATTDALTKKIGRERNPIFYLIVGSLAAVTMDLIIDPVAYVVKEYWIWYGESVYYNIPYQNFFGWFIVAFFFHFLIWLVGIEEEVYDKKWNKRLILIFYLMICMFLFIGLLEELYKAILVTSIPTAIFWWLERRKADD